MKLPRDRLARSALAVFLAGTTGVWAQERKLACDAVPAAVRAAFEKAFPEATIKGCAEEDEKGKTAYEITSTEGETGRDVLFYTDGTLAVVEETVAVRNLPDRVRQAVHKKYPDDPITLAEKVMRDAAVLYELRVRHRGKLVEAVFDADGNEMKQ